MDKQIKLEKVGRVGLLVPFLLVASGAHAALPTEATGAITTLQTDGGALVAAGWPLLVAITGGLILMGIFKKVLSRAT